MGVERKFVSEGLRRAQTNEFLLKSLEKAEYGGVDINRTPMGTQLTIFAGKPGIVIGKSGKVVRKLTSDLESTFKFDNPQIDVQQVSKPELNAQMMASSLSNLLERGWHFRKAGYNILGRVMRSGALGCEVIISGKLTGTRSRTAKFLDGYIKHSGKCTEDLVQKGFSVAKRKSGVLGVKVLVVSPDAEIADDFHIIKREEEEAQVTEEVQKDISDKKEDDVVAKEITEKVTESEKTEETKEVEEAKEAGKAAESEPVVEGDGAEAIESEKVTENEEDVKTEEVSEEAVKNEEKPTSELGEEK